jgi:hypothetical protein
MNQLQLDAVLASVDASIVNTRLKIVRLVGPDEADNICAGIDKAIRSEEPRIHSPRQSVSDSEHEIESAAGLHGAPTPTPTPDDSFVIDEGLRTETAEEKLRRYGVPAKLRSGIAAPLPSAVASSSGSHVTPSDTDEKLLIDLDQIVAEESSRKYWTDFSHEIEAGKFYRLFEILSEMLDRLKHVSPDADAAYLDELIDVDFMKQSIEEGMIDAVTFYGIFDALWTQMNRLHAPVFDKAWKEWHDSVVESMSLSDTTWTNLLPDVLNKLLIKLDEIEDAIRSLKSLLKPSSKHKHK